MKLTFKRNIIVDNGKGMHNVCRYVVSNESLLIGQFEYYSEYAYFTIGNKNYKIDSTLNLPFPFPLMKYVITDTILDKRIGTLKRPWNNFFSLRGFSLSGQEDFS